METLPLYISLIFGATTFLTGYFFYRASHNSPWVLSTIAGWLLLQTPLALSGLYTQTDAMPPRLLLAILPPLLVIIGLFVTARGRVFLDSMDQKWMTILHSVRIPVEIVLFWLFVHKTIPEVMTFEGRNFDILAGLTCPLVFYFGYVKKVLSRSVLLGWNVVCLGLLLNIVFHGVLSTPFPFQQFGFEQPNIALLHFPFVWLPCCVVPLVLLSHLATIRQLLRGVYE
ncbi:MAG: hypothetical protein SF052_01465 [Bacteroidia bacterium]|nr:hypothetical protein [Bacteroidia bacterium]